MSSPGPEMTMSQTTTAVYQHGTLEKTAVERASHLRTSGQHYLGSTATTPVEGKELQL